MYGINLSGTRITVEYDPGDGAHGASWDDPYILDDIVTDIANVTKQGNQIYIPYSLYIQGLDTYFLAEDMQVCFDGEIDDYYCLNITNAAFKSQKIAWMSLNRKNLLFNGKTDIEETIFFDFYYSIFYGKSDYSCTLKNVSFFKVQLVALPGFNYVIVENISLIDTSWFKPNNYDFESVERILIKDSAYAFEIYGRDITINNLMIDNVTTHFQIYPRYANSIMNCIDSQVDLNSRNIGAGWDGKQTINNKSTFKINIENGDSGTAKLYDQNDNLIWTETLSGELEKSVTFEGLITITSGGEVTKNEVTTYEPFKLVISKANYLDLTIPNISIEPGEETHITGKLVKPTYYHQEIKGTVEVSEVSGKVTIEDEVSGTIN